MAIDALLDSNVIIAVVAEAHEHHALSLGLFTCESERSFAVSAHSYAEAYSTLTRKGEHAPFRFSPDEAWAALESVRAATILIGLTPSQTFDTVRSYAQGGGIGARLYDRLIGEVAISHGLSAIVTWNTGHMRSLFPALRVTTPRDFSHAPN
ncbi:PIN domain-containing protein [Novosphingobium sp. G106]|uniref:type II toxin-antitoxin system VapC family toxin n=1 Tax=Novosphingobium sp. G106 TaxID=2849500 RepID=UPI001C2D2930|nr:PIN domain-containing protein [Novosphingobium sp. G106]MBV1686420.1 PIN domain-containing protein [Novosphingobium sp. G106]